MNKKNNNILFWINLLYNGLIYKKNLNLILLLLLKILRNYVYRIFFCFYGFFNFYFYKVIIVKIINFLLI